MGKLQKRLDAIERRRRGSGRLIVAFEDPETKQLLDGSPWEAGSKPIGPVGENDVILKVVYGDWGPANESAKQ